jgi:acetyltransferase-like isoleucine patch superfamily enzyme
VIAADVNLGRNVSVPHPELVNLYGCTIGDGCKIASFVEIQRGVGPRLVYQRSQSQRRGRGRPVAGGGDWAIVPTVVKRGASIGANATIVCGVTIGENALVGANSTVTHDIPPNSLAIGTPARVVGARPKR